MRRSSVFTTIDLFQGYWEIKMGEACKEQTEFICRYGTYQYEAMTFRLKNSQATFQRAMDRILLKVGNVRCFVDDVVIFSKNAEEHTMYLENVFRILKDNGLRLRIKNVVTCNRQWNSQNKLSTKMLCILTIKRLRK